MVSLEILKAINEARSIITNMILDETTSTSYNTLIRGDVAIDIKKKFRTDYDTAMDIVELALSDLRKR